MRGEQSSLICRSTQSRGSPPHARGAGHKQTGVDPIPGITPACAGSSVVSVSGWWEKRDHPRMRGEQSHSRNTSRCWRGSPPHARGAGSSSLHRHTRYRITPACAGSRLHQRHWTTIHGDHPRMRGEQTKKVQSYKGFFVFFYQISFNF